MGCGNFSAGRLRLLRRFGGDILVSAGMRRELGFIQHGSVTCYEHSISVALFSIRLAEWLRIRVDMRSMIRGALLHDYFLYDWHEPDDTHRLHAFTHAGRAMVNAERDFGLSVIERDVIAKHMFPLNLSLPRCRESVIVTLADKFCALREVLPANVRRNWLARG